MFLVSEKAVIKIDEPVLVSHFMKIYIIESQDGNKS